MLGGLGAGGGEQPDHLRHRVKDGATRLHSGELVLYCALCRQPPNLAQGRDLLTSVLNRLRHHIRLRDESELSRYERTARQSSLRTALACQEVFGTPVSELLAGLNDSVARDARGQMVKLRMRLQRKVGERPDQCDAGKVCLHHGRPAK